MLSEDINRYIEQRQTLGFKFRVQSGLLRNFSFFAESKGDQFVCIKRVLEWAEQAPSPAQRRNRLLTVRRFSVVMQAEDERYQTPPSDAFGHNGFSRGKPYIFSPEEVTALICAAAQLTPQDSMRPITYKTLFALMAVTGLRSSEALKLTLDDITDDGLIIRESKFRKSRLVPLHETTQVALSQYLIQRQNFGVKDITTTVFVSHRGDALSYSTVISIFLSLVRSLGLHEGAGHPGPRLHDLRHTFAVRSLEQCSGDSRAIKRHMTALSTYLGHAHITDTYWYLQATPMLMSQIAEAGESLYKGVLS